YATCQELAEDLQRYVKDEPIRARRPTLVQRARKWGRRHRALVASAAVALLATAFVVAASFGWVVRDREARRNDAARRAREALAIAEAFVQQENWPDGLRAVQQAEGFLAGFEGETMLWHQARQLRRELNMASQLQEARLKGARAKAGGGGFDF